MPKKEKPEEIAMSENSNLRDRPQSHNLDYGKPSLGFQFVAIGLLADILYVSKLLPFTWLFPIALGLIIIGFILLILGASKKR